VCTDSSSKFIRVRDVVRRDRDQAAVGDLQLAMELNQPFVLSAVLRAVTPATEDHDHGIWSLQGRKFSSFTGVVG